MATEWAWWLPSLLQLIPGHAGSWDTVPPALGSRKSGLVLALAVPLADGL